VLQLAIGAGLLALLLHESVDFDLQMPGIAITAVLLLGMALRGGWGRLEPGRGGSERHLSNATLSLSTLLAVVFLGLVFAQPTASGNREAPRGMMAALRSIEEFPVDSPAHLNLSLRFADLSPELALESLNAAVALNPNSPGPRDARAVLSARLGNEALALSDIEESMYRAPSRSQHPLLGSAAVSWLPAESRAAAERGFRRAAEGAGYRAVVALAGFYSGVADRESAARAWGQAADLVPREMQAAGLLRRAGWELLQAGDLDGAETLLRASIRRAPTEARPRALLIAQVMGGRGDLAGAKREHDRALTDGVERYEMDLALAEAGRLGGDSLLEIQMLKDAAALRPRDPRGYYRLGLAYFREGNYASSVTALEKTTRASPAYASAWYHLALAAERSYDFTLASQAFLEATRLDPENAYFRAQQTRFTQRFRDGRAADGGGQ
jgi:tetratricopeptide (TPR) repeat protein